MKARGSPRSAHPGATAGCEARIASLSRSLRDDAVLWISWPKQSSGRPTDLTEDVRRQVILPLGLMDVKVCAVDHTWSGLKFVRRLKHRR